MLKQNIITSISKYHNKIAVLVLGGDLPKKKRIEEQINSSNLFVAADSGIIKLFKKKLIPNYVIGDLDSIDDYKNELIDKKIKLIKIQSNSTNDFEKSLNWLIKRSYKIVTLFGVSGGDSDHTLNNFSIISKYSSNLQILIIEKNYEIIILNSKNQNLYEKDSMLGKRVSLIPLSKAKVTTNGLRWNLNYEILEFGKREGASNVSINECININVIDGCLAVYIFN